MFQNVQFETFLESQEPRVLFNIVRQEQETKENSRIQKFLQYYSKASVNCIGYVQFRSTITNEQETTVAV